MSVGLLSNQDRLLIVCNKGFKKNSPRVTECRVRARVYSQVMKLVFAGWLLVVTVGLAYMLIIAFSGR
jgi:hypothetical protein